METFPQVIQPHRPASADIIRRWVKDLFRETKIIPEYFTPHSCRSASTSKAAFTNVLIDDILKQGCWRNAKTFKTYYEKEIVNFAEDEDMYAQSIMKETFKKQ